MVEVEVVVVEVEVVVVEVVVRDKSLTIAPFHSRGKTMAVLS